jgi:hypothetical protein
MYQEEYMTSRYILLHQYTTYFEVNKNHKSIITSLSDAFPTIVNVRRNIEFRAVAVFINGNILWHVDPLLGNDREIGNNTTAVTRQRPVNGNGGTAFSVLSEPRYKQGQLDVAMS